MPWKHYFCCSMLKAQIMLCREAPMLEIVSALMASDAVVLFLKSNHSAGDSSLAYVSASIMPGLKMTPHLSSPLTRLTWYRFHASSLSILPEAYNCHICCEKRSLPSRPACLHGIGLAPRAVKVAHRGRAIIAITIISLPRQCLH